MSRGCPLVVVTFILGYAYCSCNWEYFLLVNIGEVRCIIKDQAKSAAHPSSCTHQLVSDFWVYYDVNFFPINLVVQILKLQ